MIIILSYLKLGALGALKNPCMLYYVNDHISRGLKLGTFRIEIDTFLNV